MSFSCVESLTEVVRCVKSRRLKEQMGSDNAEPCCMLAYTHDR